MLIAVTNNKIEALRDNKTTLHWNQQHISHILRLPIKRKPLCLLYYLPSLKTMIGH